MSKYNSVEEMVEDLEDLSLAPYLQEAGSLVEQDEDRDAEASYDEITNRLDAMRVGAGVCPPFSGEGGTFPRTPFSTPRKAMAKGSSAIDGTPLPKTPRRKTPIVVRNKNSDFDESDCQFAGQAALGIGRPQARSVSGPLRSPKKCREARIRSQPLPMAYNHSVDDVDNSSFASAVATATCWSAAAQEARHSAYIRHLKRSGDSARAKELDEKWAISTVGGKATIDKLRIKYDIYPIP